MSYKLILMPFYGSAQDKTVLVTALDLARKFAGHVRCLQILPEPEAVCVDIYTGVLPVHDIPALVEKENERAELHAHQVLQDMAASEGVALDLTQANPLLSWQSVRGTADTVFAEESRCFDLSVISSTASRQPYTASLLKTALFHSGRPVLVVPDQYQSSGGYKHISIAWDGKARAARAIGASLPLLQQAETVTLLTVDSARNPIPTDRLLRYLKAHGVLATHRSLRLEGNLEDTLYFSVRELLPDALVMGAYEHTSLRESLFGGMTRRMLEDCPVPLFMSH